MKRQYDAGGLSKSYITQIHSLIYEHTKRKHHKNWKRQI